MPQFVKVLSLCVTISFLVTLIPLYLFYDSRQDLWWHLKDYPIAMMYTLPVLCATALLISEPHKGWKRLSFILGIIVGFALAYPAIYSQFVRSIFTPSFVVFLLIGVQLFSFVVFLMIGGKSAALWIKDGFANSGS